MWGSDTLSNSLKITQLACGKSMFLIQTVAPGSFFAFGVFISFWYVPIYQIFTELFLCARHSPHKAFGPAGGLEIKQMITQISI